MADVDESSPDILWQQQIEEADRQIAGSEEQLPDIDANLSSIANNIAPVEEKFQKETDLIKAKQRELAKKREKEIFQTDGSLTAQVFSLLRESAELNNAASKAAQLNTHPELYVRYRPDIYSMAGKVSYEKSANSPDLLVNEWFESIKSKGQKTIDNFLFGEEEPRSIASNDEEAFATENWDRIAEIYRAESIWRNNAGEKVLEALKNLSREKSEWDAAQPDGSKLDQLKAQKKASDEQKLKIQEQIKYLKEQKERFNKRILRYRELYQEQLKKMAGTGAAPEWNEFKARNYALELVIAEEEAEKKKKEQEEQQQMAAMGLPERLGNLNQTTAPKQKQKTVRKSWQSSPETLMAAPVGRPETLAEMGTPESLTWTPREFFRHPIQFFEQKIGEGKKWIGGLFAKKQTASVAGNVAGSAAGAVIKTEAKEVVKKVGLRVGAKLLAARLVGLVSGPVGWVVTALSSKTIRKIATYSLIGLGVLLNFMFSSWAVSAFTIGGGLIGGLPGMVGGAIMGHIVEGAVVNVASGIGSWLSGTGSAAATATVTTTSAIGGFLVTTTSTAGGLAATLSAVTASSLGILSVGIASLAAIFGISTINDMNRNGIFASQPPETNKQVIEGKLFSLEKTADVSNAKVGQVINYSLQISAADSDIKITVISDDHSTGSFTVPLNLPKNTSQTIKYTYTVLATDDNKTVKNTATVTANGETLTASVSVSIGSAETCPIAPAGNACSVASLLPLDGIEGDQTKAVRSSRRCYAESRNGPAQCRCALPTDSQNWCSVENMLKYFSSDRMVAERASRICYWESSGNPTNENLGCPNNIPKKYPKSYDIGLFQIGAYTWCKGAFYEGVPDTCSNSIKNQALLDQCVKDWLDPVKNIKKAVEIYSGRGGSFSAWTSAKRQYCNIP